MNAKKSAPKSAHSSRFRYTLGLDLGVQSLGWAVVPLVEADFEQLHVGVHCFESGTGTQSDISSGKDESRNIKRRQARAIRRSGWRRTRRQIKLHRVLMNHGLLPQCDLSDPMDRDTMFKQLDAELSALFNPDGKRETAHVFPYFLRTKALDEKLSLHAFGRAIYHLAQRRGFLSNRKTAGSDEAQEEEGVVKAGIHQLQMEIQESGARTLGEYFSMLDPEAEHCRIRQRWTARSMYEDEFNQIWNAQEHHHPKLKNIRHEIDRAIFFQRPLKSQRDKLGKCEIFPGKRRAAKACLEFQEFRCWQKILDLEYWQEDGFSYALTPDQQDQLAAMMQESKAVTFPQIKLMLGFKRNAKVFFNLEAGGNKSLPGNTTYARLSAAIPKRWATMTDDEKSQLVSEILQFEREEALAKRLMKVFGFTPTEAEALSVVPMENGYASFSRPALRAILAKLKEKRVRLNTVLTEDFKVEGPSTDPLDALPPVLEAVKDLRNPVVTRSLTEVRKVVNAIIRRYGKPEFIRIEMARDMKKSRKQRENDFRAMRTQEKKRADAREKIIKEVGIKEPTGTDILKVLLAEECHWTCPFTGKTITPQNLLGEHPQFDIEHILPFSRSLDNSFMNKTLCDHNENVHVKRGQTPFETYSANEQRYHEIQERVKKFQTEANSKFPNPKLRRFKMEEIPQDFASRMLNDTRYICRLATDYLGLLYGGQIELEEGNETGTRRIHVCTGKATAWLRDEWGLNAILNDGGVDEKDRSDHRHHAVDAVAIAFCEMSIVKRMADSAEEAQRLGLRRRFVLGGIRQPWGEYFFPTVKSAIDRIHVSYKASHKVSGALHEETNYSKPHTQIDEKTRKPVEVRYVRKPLASMSENDIKAIVDPGIRQLVLDKIKQMSCSMKDAAKRFQDDANLPYRMVTDKKTGHTRYVPVRKARFRKVISIKEIGGKANQRFVATGGNHHMEVIAHLDKDGNETKWEGVTVTLFEAYQRRKAKQPVIQRDHGPGKLFKFSLARNEFLLFANEDETVSLKRLFKMSGQRIGWGDHNDARPANDVTDRTPGNSPSINTLRGKVQKVTVDYLGNIHPAND